MNIPGLAGFLVTLPGRPRLSFLCPLLSGISQSVHPLNESMQLSPGQCTVGRRDKLHVQSPPMSKLSSALHFLNPWLPRVRRQGSKTAEPRD